MVDIYEPVTPIPVGKSGVLNGITYYNEGKTCSYIDTDKHVWYGDEFGNLHDDGISCVNTPVECKPDQVSQQTNSYYFANMSCTPSYAEERNAGGGKKVIDNSWQATIHYLFGDGSPVKIGPKTTQSLLQSPEFQKYNKAIMDHTKNGNGSFSVNMTDRVFHIGRTSVSYSINPNDNTVTYNLFTNDGFWDPDFIDERYAHYFSTSNAFTPDGKGPNLERFGGTPYDYIPVTITYNIP